MIVSRLVLCVLLGVASIDGKPPSKIFGGSNAYEGEFPYQVGLMADSELFCGGTIIDSRHILTATHCLEDVNLNSFKGITVIAGTINLESPNATLYRIKSFIKYPQSPQDKNKTGVNDVAILTLASEIKFDSKKQPVKLPTRDTPAGLVCQASGWGDVDNVDKAAPTILQKLDMRLLSNQQCSLLVNEPVEYYKICAKDAYGSGLCSGDSGGPLVCDDGTLVGVDSYVFNGCATGYPEVFMRVWSFVDWIKKSISEQ